MGRNIKKTDVTTFPPSIPICLVKTFSPMLFRGNRNTVHQIFLSTILLNSDQKCLGQSFWSEGVHIFLAQKVKLDGRMFSHQLVDELQAEN